MGHSGTWPEHLNEIVEEFSACFDSMERYELLFQYAKKHPSPLPPEEWNESNQVHGCQSRAHVICSLDEKGGFILRGGADAQIVQGLMAITAIAVNGAAPSSVASMNPEFADAMGIRASLTPSRANGFLNMFNRIIEEAGKLSEQ
ncbi:MAG TPA: SufE family protein [Candidatus Thalassarchaeaceae archaeon]|jgi:cysteine desulfuration protein SufE|nr:SufE family protein [Candidatus Thalassarchaeaceae archaeon]|tara:strand:+ start:6435 stop:6869 length:435 start_codon:yes stop_codon:yes gene_type:complete